MMTRRLSLLAALAVVCLASDPAAAQSKITVYSAGPQNLIDALGKGFTAESGVQVGIFQGTTGQVMARIEAEASNPVVDVLISASWDTATDFAKRGWLVKHSSPNAAKVPANLKTEFAVAQGISALGIAWNPTTGTPKPEDWSDLAKPAYKDQVTMPDPAQSGSSFELVAALVGKGDWSLFEKLKANGMVVVGANAQALNPVLQGAKSAVFGAVDYISLGQKVAGEKIDVIFPKSGTVVAPRPAMVLNWSKNQDAAKKFIDYMLSDKGQAEVAKVYLMPARTDVKADRPLIGDLKLLPLDTTAAYAGREATLAKLKAVTGGK